MKAVTPVITALVLAPATAMAHEGHGVTSGIFHYALEPVHLIPLVAVAVAAGAWMWRRRQLEKS